MAKSTSFSCRNGKSAHQGVRRRPEKRANASPQGSKVRRAARGARFWEILYIFPKENARNSPAQKHSKTIQIKNNSPYYF